MAAAYRLWRLLTADGRLLTGSIAAESATAVQVVDARGQVTTIPSAEIEMRQPLPDSPMPANPGPAARTTGSDGQYQV